MWLLGPPVPCSSCRAGNKLYSKLATGTAPTVEQAVQAAVLTGAIPGQAAADAASDSGGTTAGQPRRRLMRGKHKPGAAGDKPAPASTNKAE